MNIRLYKWIKGLVVTDVQEALDLLLWSVKATSMLSEVSVKPSVQQAVEAPKGRETSRLSRFLDIPLTDGLPL
jgi:hypothetical protein